MSAPSRWGGVGLGSSGAVASTTVGAAGTASVDGSLAATNVTLTGSANVVVTMPTDGSTLVRIIQGGSGGYTPTFKKPDTSAITWAPTDQPGWTSMAAGDVVEVRVWSVAGAVFAEWGYDIPALKTRTTTLETTAAKTSTLLLGVGSAVVNTATETTLVSSAVAAGAMAAGDVVDCEFWWRVLAVTAGSPSLTVRFKIDSTAVLTRTLAMTSAPANRLYRLNASFSVTSNTDVSYGLQLVGGTATGSGSAGSPNNSSGTSATAGDLIWDTPTVPDLSSARTLYWTAQWAVADSAWTFTPISARVIRRRP